MNRLIRIAGAVALSAVFHSASSAVGIQGTMSNFDVFNDTPSKVSAYGAQLELEGVHAADVTGTYPSHFTSMVKADTTFGVRITYSGYSFQGNSSLAWAPGQSTNGHYCVNLSGCEHFGYAVSTQPTTSRFFWIDNSGNRINAAPLSIPSASWTYVPPAVVGQPAALQAQIAVPQPEVPEAMLPDSVWVKTFVTESSVAVQLNDLLSGTDLINNAQVETEWSLLEGGVPDVAEAPIGANAQSVIRRYEYYRYAGAYDPTDHAPISAGVDPDTGLPLNMNEVGGFISANMAAVNLVPEPEIYALMIAGIGLVGFIARRRDMRPRALLSL